MELTSIIEQFFIGLPEPSESDVESYECAAELFRLLCLIPTRRVTQVRRESTLQMMLKSFETTKRRAIQ